MIDHSNACEILTDGVCTCKFVQPDPVVRMRTCSHCGKDVYRDRCGLWTHVYPSPCEDEHG